MIKELLRKDFDVKKLSKCQIAWLKMVQCIPEIKLFHGDIPTDLDYELSSEVKEILTESDK